VVQRREEVGLALEAAHEQGIIHRDLKPANIKLRPDGVVKVLDFGLAKAMDNVGRGFSPAGHAGPEGPAYVPLSQSPTITTPAMTQAGMILGTAAYMSPEQARGKPVDKRADIWAFGVVLFEMLTGKRLFNGETVSDVMAAVLTKEPDWSALPAGTPPSIGVLLQRCLRREAERAGREALFAVQNPSGDLPFADWEVEEAAQYFRQQHILPGAQATLAQVKRLIAQGHEVLLSCHGTYELNDVFASHLILHGDDRLLLSDILQLDLSNAWLVVLSACETALSDYLDVLDEVQGLHTAFLIAGAPTVVGSLWAVDSLATALLMQRFHANLYTGRMPKVSALREAQQWLRELSITEARALLSTKRDALQRAPADEKLAMLDLTRARFTLDALASMYGDTPFAHPYWWAAFQCLGAS